MNWYQSILWKNNSVMPLPNSTVHGISYKSYVIYKNVCPEGWGGYFHMYAYWVCAARERSTPIFSPEFLFWSISFSKISPNPFRFITILLFLVDFAVPERIFLFSVPEHHHFTFFWRIFRLGDRHFPNAKRLAAGQSASAGRVPESSIFTLKTALARSGAPQNGSNSFRRPSFSRTWGGGISSSDLSVFFTDICYKLLKSLHPIGWEQICQWKTLTKCLIKCSPGACFGAFAHV